MRSLPSMRPARVREGSLSTDRQRRHRTSKSYPKVSQLTVTHKYGNMQGMKTTLEFPTLFFAAPNPLLPNVGFRFGRSSRRLSLTNSGLTTAAASREWLLSASSGACARKRPGSTALSKKNSSRSKPRIGCDLGHEWAFSRGRWRRGAGNHPPQSRSNRYSRYCLGRIPVRHFALPRPEALRKMVDRIPPEISNPRCRRTDHHPVRCGSHGIEEGW